MEYSDGTKLLGGGGAGDVEMVEKDGLPSAQRMGERRGQGGELGNGRTTTGDPVNAVDEPGPGRNKAPPLKDWWNTVTMASGGRDSLLGGGRGLKAWLGLDDSSYDWAWLCKPRSPWSPPGPPPPFFGNEEQLPLIVAVVMGLQHSLAMIASIVTVPLFIGGPFNARLSQEEQQYLIAAGMIYAGIGSFIQVYRLRLPQNLTLGTGLICVIGTSFTFVPIATAGMQFMMREDTDASCVSDRDCTPAWAGQSPPYLGVSIPGVTNAGQCNLETSRCRMSGQEAYGKILGTCMAGSFLEMALSFTPKRTLRRFFPQTVTGVCVTLIGVGLTGTGMMYWGGGILCANNSHKRMAVTLGPTLPGNITGRAYPSTSPCRGGACRPGGSLYGRCAYTEARFVAELGATVGDRTECEAFADLPGVAPALPSPKASWITCGGNGAVSLPFGSPQYVALGASVIAYIIALEVFGSPFARNCSVAISLFLGFLTAAMFSYTPPEGGDSLSYISLKRVSQAPFITFFWAETFPLGIYTPALFPIMICYVITTVESIGDITASCEASRVETEGGDFDSRLQGGLLADGVNSFLSCLCTSMPNTTFSQNNGVISLTRCASRKAGFACCGWMVLFGVLAKLSALVTSVPDCVLGGMVTFLFANISVSGLRILGQHDMDRKDRIVVASGLALGIGVAIVPAWATNALLPPTPGEDGAARLMRESVIIILSSPYSIGTLVAVLLNAVIPRDAEEGPSHEAGPSEDTTEEQTALQAAV